MRRHGFTLVEMMVVLAVIAILTVVSVPMYARFKQKAATSNAVKACMGYTGALQSWYDERSSFSGIVVSEGADGWTLNSGSTKIGTSLPIIEKNKVSWSVSAATSSFLQLSWTFTSSKRCVGARCNGAYCITCSDIGCRVEISYTDNEFGLSRNPEGDACP